MMVPMLGDVLHYLGDFRIAGLAVQKWHGALQGLQLAYISAAVATYQ